MNDRFRRMILGVGATVIAVGTAAALYASSQNTAQGPRSFMGRRGPFAGLAGPFGPLRRIASRLGLDDAQKGQIKGIIQAHRDEWKALGGRAIAAHKGLTEAVSADPIDEAAIRQRSTDLAAVQADIAVARAHAREEIFQVLTPDQQAQAKAMRSRMAGRLDGIRQRFQGPPRQMA